MRSNEVAGAYFTQACHFFEIQKNRLPFSPFSGGSLFPLPIFVNGFSQHTCYVPVSMLTFAISMIHLYLKKSPN